MPGLGPLLASGRGGDIFAYGRDLVVRRSRRGRSMEREAGIMRYVARHGYPAPRVEDVRANGSELVMERIDGPTMLEVLSKRPWTLRRNAGRLAMLHLDLHPLNVILSPQGPRLIDWTNAACGTGPADVALTWLLIATADIPGGAIRGTVGRVFRTMFVRSFLGHFEIDAVRTVLPAVGMWKCEDRKLRPGEVAAMRQLVAAESSQR